MGRRSRSIEVCGSRSAHGADDEKNLHNSKIILIFEE